MNSPFIKNDKIQTFYLGDIIIILIKERYTIVVKANRTLEMC